VTVANTGGLAGDEVVLLFQRPSAAVRGLADHTLPIKRLIGFERVTVGVGASGQVHFDVTKSMLALATNNTDGVLKVYEGEHELVFWRGNGDEHVFKVVVGSK
jgi:beta-glucosidase